MRSQISTGKAESTRVFRQQTWVETLELIMEMRLWMEIWERGNTVFKFCAEDLTLGWARIWLLWLKKKQVNDPPKPPRSMVFLQFLPVSENSWPLQSLTMAEDWLSEIKPIPAKAYGRGWNFDFHLSDSLLFSLFRAQRGRDVSWLCLSQIPPSNTNP